jgi:hypothetical protein
MCMYILFHTVLVTFLIVSLVVFSSTVSTFPFSPGLISLITPPPLSRISCPFPLCPLTLWAFFSHLFVFFEFFAGYKLFPIIQSCICFVQFLISYKLFIILMNSMSVLCLVPCPVFVWVRLGSLPLVFVAGSCGDCVH